MLNCPAEPNTKNSGPVRTFPNQSHSTFHVPSPVVCHNTSITVSVGLSRIGHFSELPVTLSFTYCYNGMICCHCSQCRGGNHLPVFRPLKCGGHWRLCANLGKTGWWPNEKVTGRLTCKNHFFCFEGLWGFMYKLECQGFQVSVQFSKLQDSVIRYRAKLPS